MTTDSPWPLSRIRVSGQDAISFLQGQLTCDLEQVDEGQIALAAWCNPKGRVITILRVRMLGDEVDLFLPAELAQSVEKRLVMFRFRAKVAFDRGAASGEDLDTALDADAWCREQLEHGIAFIGEVQSEKFTPHMLNLDLLDAVSFDKGCYTGQEVVARTHYRGATKRRMLKFSGAADASAGDKIELDGRDVGEVVNAVDGRLLAVVPVDKAGAGLTLGGAALTLEALPYIGAD